MIEVEMTSLEIAELTGRHHRSITRSIRDKIRRGENLPVRETSYTTLRNKKYPMFLVEKDYAEFLIKVYNERGKVASSLEKEYLNSIQKLLPRLKIERQKRFGKYCVDAFCDESFIIEIDEKYHNNKETEDKTREEALQPLVKEYILEVLERDECSYLRKNDIMIFRVREGLFFEDVSKIISHLLDEDILYHFL